MRGIGFEEEESLLKQNCDELSVGNVYIFSTVVEMNRFCRVVLVARLLHATFLVQELQYSLGIQCNLPR